MPIYGNIRKFKFDLILTEERVFEPLSNDLINLVKKNLLEITEDVFSPFETRNIVVDKIEIDVGIINPRDLNSLLRNFKSKLDDYVQKNLNKSTFQNQERLAEAILFFIQNGYFPWWVRGVVSFNEISDDCIDLSIYQPNARHINDLSIKENQLSSIKTNPFLIRPNYMFNQFD